MPLTLSLATPSDLPNLVRAQYTAFHPADTLHVLIYPSPDPVPEAIFDKTVQRQKDAWKENVTWVKVTDDETGTVVAGAKWIFYPESAKEEEKRWPDSFGVDAVKEMRREDEQTIAGVEGAKNAGRGVEDLEYISWVMEDFMGRRRRESRVPLWCWIFVTRILRGKGREQVSFWCNGGRRRRMSWG